jgi:hypothetical protein
MFVEFGRASECTTNVTVACPTEHVKEQSDILVVLPGKRKSIVFTMTVIKKPRIIHTNLA